MSKRLSGTRFHDQIVAAVVGTYQHKGLTATPSWKLNGQRTGDDPDLILPELRRVEEVVTNLEEIRDERLERLRALGFEVWVLVPLTQMGLAHSRLRGLADRIQGWSVTEGRIRFGEPRLP